MGILDEAIREHLELKRQHGAAEEELKQLEDEAFGPPERPGELGGAPDLFAEAPTEFMAPREAEEEALGEAGSEPAPGERAPNVADLQEPPPEATPPAEPNSVEAPHPRADDAEPGAANAEEAGESHPAAEQWAGAPDAEPGASGSSTEERHAIAEQPTELYDVEREIAASGPPAHREDQPLGGPPASSESPPLDEDEPLAEPPAESEEHPAAEYRVEEPAGEVEEAEGEAEGAAGEVEEEDDDFFDEQRLSDELDQALDAPLEDVEEETGEDAFAAEPAGIDDAMEGSEEAPRTVADDAEADAEDGDGEEERGQTAGARDREDLLDDTPSFLADAPEDDQLWFEQKPPSDFDFDD